MITIGYSLAGEEHGPNDLVRFAQRAEDVGFEFTFASDHYHPWVDRQGNSPFVWCVIGGVAQTTTRLRLGTGVTCPIMRIHPAIIAQAAATAAAMLPQRFFLGLGTGENLNEHILGNHWPEGDVRLEMLEEAVEIIRELWSGEDCSHRGRYYTVEEACIYTLPDELPPIYVAADGRRAAELAGRVGDGLVGVAPKAELIEQFREAGGEGKPCYAHFTACWGETEKEARRTAHEVWPTSGLHGNLSWEIKTPRLFEAAVKNLSEEEAVESIVCGPEPGPYLERIGKFESAGYDFVSIHNVGPDQEAFFEFFEDDLAPQLVRPRRSA